MNKLIHTQIDQFLLHYSSCICPFINLNSLFLSVFQSDNLLSYLTVEETLTYTAQLALQKHSVEAIKKKVNYLRLLQFFYSRFPKSWLKKEEALF